MATTHKTATKRAPELSISIEQVTPDMARQWLDTNHSNRRIRWAKVRKYMRDMSAGNWLITGEAIKFDEDGQLVDGQHRLHAIIESEATISTCIARGIERTSQNVMDTGITRQLHDQLSIAGLKNSTLLASAGRWAMIFDSDLLNGVDNKKRTALTHAELLDYIDDANGPLTDAVSRVASYYRTTIDMPPSAMSACYYLLSRIDAEEAQLFFDRIADGINLEAGSPILALRSRLRAIKNDRTRLDAGQHMNLLLRTWNAWRQGQKMRTIPLMKDGSTIAVGDLI